METNKWLPLLAMCLVGITFLFSGFIKLNDPVGFGYKIEEYLHLLGSQWSQYFRLFLPYTLALAVAIATLEVLLGVALLVGWQHYWTLRALLLLTLFFTGLTLYTAASGRMASCGCFGEAWDLTPWQSFAKSVVLLLLIGGLLRSTGVPTASLQSPYWMAAALLGSLALSTYSIRHLPWLELGPYAVGRSLAERPRTRQPFLSVWQGQEEVTQSLRTGHKLLIIAQGPAALSATQQHRLRSLIQRLPADLQPVLISADERIREQELGLPVHTAAPTLLRAFLRAPAGLLLLHEGVVKGKWHAHDLAQAQKQLCPREGHKEIKSILRL